MFPSGGYVDHSGGLELPENAYPRHLHPPPDVPEFAAEAAHSDQDQALEGPSTGENEAAPGMDRDDDVDVEGKDEGKAVEGPSTGSSGHGVDRDTAERVAKSWQNDIDGSARDMFL